MKNKQKAFTLSEVLITLGIIGVIAAMTIPQIVAKYKKVQISSTLKQTVSMLQQAILRSSDENGPPYAWTSMDRSSKIVETHIAPYLDITKKCTTNTQNPIIDIKDPCYSTISLINGTIAYPTSSKFILKNGTAFVFIGYGTSNQRRGTFFIVVENKPNKLILGKNVFPVNLIAPNPEKFYITSTKDFYAPTQLCSPSLRTRVKSDCLNPTQGWTMGGACTAMIECNNWEVPNDYPIKL